MKDLGLAARYLIEQLIKSNEKITIQSITLTAKNDDVYNDMLAADIKMICLMGAYK